MRSVIRKVVPFRIRQAIWRVRNRRPFFREVESKKVEADQDWEWRLDLLSAFQSRSNASLENRPRAYAELPRMLVRKNIGDDQIETAAALAADALVVWAVLEYHRGNFRKATELAATVPADAAISPRILKSAWDSLRDIGRYDLSLKGFATKSGSIAETKSVTSRRGHLLFAQKGYDLFARYMEDHASEDPKGYVILFDINHRITSGLMVPIGLELLRQGYDLSSVIPSTMPVSDRPELQGISGSLRTNGTSLTNEPSALNSLHNQWIIDWENEIVSCGGINYFTFFMERISKQQGVYRGNLDAPESRSLFNAMLRRSDLALVVCDRLIKLAETTGKPVRIVAMDTHFAPWGVVRRWCEHIGKRYDIHLVGLSVAYENYFSNLSTLVAGTVAVEDMTQRPDVRHPLLGGRYRLDEFIASDPDVTTRRERVLEWIKIDRSGRRPTDEDEREYVLAKIEQTRAVGQRVFCALGKVLLDFAAPDDRGHVFKDFPSWIRGLVKFAEETGSLLIIKPHPHELRQEIVNQGSQTMRDLLPENLPENVIFLRHSSFNSAELADHVDACFVWNGTAYPEYHVIGRAVFAESEWAEKDYPIDGRILANVDDYRSVFDGTSPLDVSEAATKRATAYMQFIKSDFVSIPLGYVRRAATNKAIGPNIFYEDQLLDLETNGDANVSKAAARFFEFAGP